MEVLRRAQLLPHKRRSSSDKRRSSSRPELPENQLSYLVAKKLRESVRESLRSFVRERETVAEKLRERERESR